MLGQLSQAIYYNNISSLVQHWGCYLVGIEKKNQAKFLLDLNLIKYEIDQFNASFQISIDDKKPCQSEAILLKCLQTNEIIGVVNLHSYPNLRQVEIGLVFIRSTYRGVKKYGALLILIVAELARFHHYQKLILMATSKLNLYRLKQYYINAMGFKGKIFEDEDLEHCLHGYGMLEKLYQLVGLANNDLNWIAQFLPPKNAFHGIL